MAYIGKTPITGNFVKLDAISVVNGQAGYTMNNGGSAFTDYENVNQFLVSLNGILQAPTDSFSVSGSTLTFASNLSTGDVIDFVIVLGNTLDIGTPSDATVTNAKTNFVSTSSSAGLQIKGDNTTAGTLQLNCEQNSHGIKLRSPAHSSGQSYTIVYPTSNITAGKFLKVDSVSGSGTTGVGQLSFADGGGAYESQLLHVRDEKSTNTSGGAATGGSQHVRDLNTVKTNEITGASLSSNQITLPAGTYFISARAPAFMVNAHKIFLYNTTDASNTLIGSSSYADASYQSASDSVLFGRFTIGAQKVFELKHDIGTSRSANGLGVETNLSGVVEVYAEVLIWKVS